MRLMAGEMNREVKTICIAVKRKARVEKFRLRCGVAMVQIKCSGSSEEKYFGENPGGMSGRGTSVHKGTGELFQAVFSQ